VGLVPLRRCRRIFLSGLFLLLVLSGCALHHEAPLPVPAAGELVIYVRSGCPFCAEALTFLRGMEITATVRDISEKRLYYQQLQQIYREKLPRAKLIVPLLLRDGHIVRGFSPDAILDLLDHESPASAFDSGESGCDSEETK